MKLYPENYTVAVTFPFVDLNQQPVAPTEVSAKLYDGEDQLVIDFGVLPIEDGASEKEIVVPAALNVLGVGQLTAGRVLRVQLKTEAGVLRRSFSYMIEGEFRLAIMVNSFQTLESAEILARDTLNLNGWLMADDERRYIALVEAFNRLTRIPMRFKHLETDNPLPRHDLFAQETVVLRSTWGEVTEEDFLAWPLYFRKALRAAQLVEANELLEGDPIAKKHRAGIISETVGESSIMLRGGKVDHGVSSATLQHLAGHIYYNHRIVRA
jgi:hypothetical protein